jgi:glutamate carboxypeptidase
LNRVPHEALAELEMRAFEPQVLTAAGKTVMALQNARPPSGQAVLRVECLGATPPWPDGAETRQLLAHWNAAAGDLDCETRSTARGGLSDANYLSHLGPTLDGLGPAGGNAHCSERSADGSKVPEYVESDSFVPKAALNVLALLRMLAS